MRFYRLLLFYFRKIQIHIVTIFFLLISLSSLIIIFYNYHKSYEGTHNLSNEVIQQVSNGLIDNIGYVTRQTELLSKVTRGVITPPEEFAQEIPILVSYLLNTLKSSNSMLFSIGVATLDGYYVCVIDLAIANFSNYYTRPHEMLPGGSKYAARVINNAVSPSTEHWQYLGTDGSVLGEESFQPSSYDPRTDAWFTSMKDWPSLQWDNALLPRGVGKFYPHEEPGLTVSVPVFDANNAFYAMVGVNISLNYLSNYITHQQIGKSGKAFVLDSEGHLLVPTLSSLDPASSTLAQAVVSSAYKHYQEKSQEHFFLKKGEMEYIVYIQDFPLSLDNEWMIVIAVPFDDFFGEISKTQNETIVISLVILIIFCIQVFFFSKRISVPIIQLAKEVDKIRHFDFQGTFSVKSNIHEIKILDTSISAMRRALDGFGKYVPKEVVKALLEQKRAITLGGEKLVLPILFSDVTDFTTISESLSSEQTLSALSLYFDALSKVILESQGTIDKYIGDSVMAFWGAPLPVEDPVKKACLTALRANRVCNEQAKALRLPDWKTRFGIHLGEVIVGNIGTSERMNYTVIGDVVNTASRLTALNKEYKTAIMISDAVQKQLGEEFVTRPLDFVAVKGKKIKLTVYELMGTRQGEFAPTREQLELCQGFTEAYAVLQAGRLDEGRALFAALAQRFPGDGPTQKHLG